MTDPGMKCSRCRQPARHRLPSHNSRFCDPCLALFLRRQVERAIKKYRLLAPGQKVMVAVSGGKDSAVLWQVLSDLGYETQGLHLDLGLGDFSQASRQACQDLAAHLDRPLHLASLQELTGFGIAQVAQANRRQFCAICGVVKRHFVNRLCMDLKCDTLATGHHLDDEAGRLLGNLIHQRQDFLQRQWPCLEGLAGGLAKRIKPLCRLDGGEIKAYALSQGLPHAQDKCPRSRGATLHYFQEALELMEQRMPGTKRAMYFGFLEAKKGPPPAPVAASRCQRCGAPTYLELCNCCRLLERTAEHLAAKSQKAGQDPDQGPEAE